MVYVSVVTLAEVEYGLLVSPAIDPRRQAIVKDTMFSFEVLQIDRHTSQEYARIRAGLFRKYSPKDRRGRIRRKYVADLVERTTDKQLGIQENDLWIVSTAVQYDLVFATRDRMDRLLEEAGHFEKTEFWIQ